MVPAKHVKPIVLGEMVETEEDVTARPPQVLVVESFEERVLAPYEAPGEGSAKMKAGLFLNDFFTIHFMLCIQLEWRTSDNKKFSFI